jgi:hypothetical protein
MTPSLHPSITLGFFGGGAFFTGEVCSLPRVDIVCVVAVTAVDVSDAVSSIVSPGTVAHTIV